MAENNVNRKLAAILSADVVGYSRLMQDDEAATVTTLKAYRALISEIAGQHKGRVVNAPGDSILAEFASAVEAVQAAIDIQRAVAQRNAQLAEHRRMQFRIGVNLGDVIEEDDGTLYGDGVNIAARMEALADTGGIVVSGTVQEHVRGRLDAEFADIGRQAVKNIAQPVQAYRIIADGIAASTATSTPARHAVRWPALAAAVAVVVALAGAGVWWSITERQVPMVEPVAPLDMAHPLPEKPSVTILPFDYISADIKHAHIAEGLTENIIATVSQLDELVLITNDGAVSSASEVAKALGVQFVLSGHVQIDGENMRVTARLIDALTGKPILSERYDRQITDLFSVQDEITLNVVAAMQVELTAGTQALSWRGGTRNLEAWSLWQRGRTHLFAFTPEQNQEARKLFTRALEDDPDYALAYSGLAATHMYDARYGWSENQDDDLARAEVLVNKAIQFAEDLPNPYSVLSHIRLTQRRFEDAVAAGQASIKLNPNSPVALASHANILWRAGRAREAIEHMSRAMRLFPQYPAWYASTMAMSKTWSGEHEEAIDYAQEIFRRLPGQEYWGYRALIHAYVSMGEIEQAKTAVKKLLTVYPEFSIVEAKRLEQSRYPLAEQVRDKWFSILRRAGVPEAAPSDDSARPSIAVLPFDNLSGDDAQDYFVDGLTEEIIGTLSRFPDLAVIARNSTFRYKGQAVDIRVVSEELGSKYMVEGSVRRGGETIRVAAQLVESESGSQLWSESYDRALTSENVFAIQDDIAAAIATSLAGRYGILRQEGLAAARRKPPNDLRSYDCVLLSMEFLRTNALEDYRTARDCLERAVEAEPDYAEAWSHLASIYVREDIMGYDPRPGSLDRALNAARRGVELSPDGPWQHWWLAYTHFFRGEHDEFKAAVNRATDGAANGSNVQALAGLFLAYAGEWDRGLALIEEAKTYDPFFPRWYHFGEFFDHYRHGAYEAALAAAQKINMPDYIWAQALLAGTYGQLGRADDARPYVKRILELDPDFESTAWENRWKFFRYQEDLLDHFMDGLRKAGLSVEVKGN